MPERLRYSDFASIDRKKSDILTDTLVEDPDSEQFRCPKCDMTHLPIKHGKRLKCRCGLTMERSGNDLDMWTEQEEKKPR